MSSGCWNANKVSTCRPSQLYHDSMTHFGKQYSLIRHFIMLLITTLVQCSHTARLRSFSNNQKHFISFKIYREYFSRHNYINISLLTIRHFPILFGDILLSTVLFFCGYTQLPIIILLQVKTHFVYIFFSNRGFLRLTRHHNHFLGNLKK